MIKINKSDVFCILIVVVACTQVLVLSSEDNKNQDHISASDQENYLLKVPTSETTFVYKEISDEN